METKRMNSRQEAAELLYLLQSKCRNLRSALESLKAAPPEEAPKTYAQMTKDTREMLRYLYESQKRVPAGQNPE
jgi:hypothetical protein